MAVIDFAHARCIVIRAAEAAGTYAPTSNVDGFGSDR